MAEPGPHGRRTYTLFSDYLGEDWRDPTGNTLDEYLDDKMELAVYPLEGSGMLDAFIIWDGQNGIASLICGLEECDRLPWISDVLARLAKVKKPHIQPHEVVAIVKECGFENTADLAED